MFGSELDDAPQTKDMMMAIHHTQIKKANALGIQLTEIPAIGEDDSALVRAFFPSRGIQFTDPDAKVALDGIQRAIALAELAEYNAAAAKLPVPSPEPEEEDEVGHEASDFAEDPRSNEGVALDGAVAYREGTVTADCPFDAESDDDAERTRADVWYTEWDEAADEASAAKEEEHEGGSVVSQKYRARYAEAGHPTHCGDWLADTLNGIVANKAGTNLELFEDILAANDVSVAHLDRTKRGWEGRLRMTGRNLLARKVFIAGVLHLPIQLGGDKTPTAEWIATRKFKKA